jgi:hypothetical protein
LAVNRPSRKAPPRAAAMLESLRGLGYSTAAALADIIDNSIAAGATEVRVSFDWHCKNSSISVLDNGRGMLDAELELAMRLGAISPLQARAAHDLGRFGMGLKTASLSQCRRLTVASIKAGMHSCLRWDLAELAANPDSDWLLFEGPAPGSEHRLAPLGGRDSGTLVLWEDLDRIVTAGYGADDFIDLVEQVEVQLAMVFHRLIAGPRPRFRLLLNGKPVEARDPFMTGHAAKPWTSPLAKRTEPYGAIEVQCHVLPHRDRLTDEEFAANAGPQGWSAQQGFYIYRNERLLVAGGWLGLGHPRAWNREEAHRLARIRLDLPNTADAEWKIDIRKSTARPPVSVRLWLTALAQTTRDKARQVFAYRGTPGPTQAGEPVAQAWHVERLKNDVRYRIDTAHPAVSSVLDRSGELRPQVLAMLKVIEETVPVQRIWLDTMENKETPRTGFEGEPPEAAASVLQTLFADMIGRRGMSPDAARRALLATEPFNRYPGLVGQLKGAEE